MLYRIAAWSLVVKVPILVATLVITGAFTISQVVLWRYFQDQKGHLKVLTSAYLDGVSAAVLPATMRGDVWEVFDVLDRSRTRYAGVKTRLAIVELPNGRVLAASDPQQFPVQSELPNDLRRRFAANDDLLVDAAVGRAWLARTLSADGLLVGRLLAEIDIADLLRFKREILLALLFVNGCLTLAFAFGGYFVLRGMLRPFDVLSRHMEQIRDGCVEPIPRCQRMRVSGEFGQLFDRFNAMARALNEQQMLQAELGNLCKTHRQ
jgi:HAMP domain